MAGIPAVAVVGVIAFLVGKNDVPPIRDSTPVAHKTGVSPPASETVLSESKNVPTPIPGPPVDPVPKRPPGTVSRDPLKDGTEGSAMVVEPAGTVASEPKDDSTPLPGPTVVTVPGQSPGTVFRDRLKDGSQGPAMVVVPAGTFRMGDSKGVRGEQPVHGVTLKAPFALGQFEVTVGEFRRFVESAGYRAEAERKKRCAGWSGRFRFKPGFQQDDRHPVVCVSWRDARAYAEWLSGQSGYAYRLPTEAEWEFAARAGTETSYWWGHAIGRNQANCNGCGSQ